MNNNKFKIDEDHPVVKFIEKLKENSLEEIGSSMVKVTKKTKRQRFAGSMAMKIAKDRNDGSYKMYQKHRTLMLKFKSKIMQKYGKKALSQARKTMK